MKQLTPLLGLLIVVLTDEFIVFHEIELVARVELSLAQDARKAVQVVHIILCTAHHLCWRDALLTSRTFGAKPSGAGKIRVNLCDSL